MFCPKCGSENEATSGFCGSCGASLKKDTSPNKIIVEPKRSNKRVIGILSSLVLVILIGIFVVTQFGVVGKSGSDSATTNSNPIASVLPIEIKNSTNDYTWEELSRISNEIANSSSEDEVINIAIKYNLTNAEGKLDGNQKKEFKLANGSPAEVRIAGFAHDEKTEGGKAGITFFFAYGLPEHNMNSANTNSGGWERSGMRSWLASEAIKMLPDGLQEKIVEVKKLTNNKGETSSTESVTATNDKLFLFSEVEIVGKNAFGKNASGYDSYKSYYQVFEAEGFGYAAFVDAQKESSMGMASMYGASEVEGWLRSPNCRDTKYFCELQYYGYPRNYGEPSDDKTPLCGFAV